MLKIIAFDSGKYLYFTEMKDNRKNAIFLSDKYFKDTHYKKYEKGRYYFDNSFSKTFITSNELYMRLNIQKLVQGHRIRFQNLPLERQKDIQYITKIHDTSIKKISKKFEFI